ncbi:transcription factor bHLH162-like [Herrania umbratica]|uniref:Transcription factor bHLH162-like n=1 Tax=Herrania umbratica TaxID=108875 RepID=A0A6J1BA60_9ROSI|nr:transcription factor bHLH162-like [Herrania umbratica]
MQRCLIERERRSNMNNLYSKLFSLLPPQPTKMSILGNLELATVHIKELQRQVEELKRRKMQLEEESQALNRAKSETITPVLNIIESHSVMQVNLVIGSDMKFILGEVISIIEEEGAEVAGATYNHAGKVNRNILSIHCETACSNIGFKSSKVLERLKTLIKE